MNIKTSSNGKFIVKKRNLCYHKMVRKVNAILCSVCYYKVVPKYYQDYKYFKNCTKKQVSKYGACITLWRVTTFKFFLATNRSSRLEVFYKKSVLILQNWLPESLFNKVSGLMSATLLKKRLWHRCFPVNFPKFLRTLILTEHLR